MAIPGGAAALLAWFGCSSSTGGGADDSGVPPPGSDSGSSSGSSGSSGSGSSGSADAGDAGPSNGECNALSNQGAEPTLSESPSMAPAPAGGTIVAGTYYLTENDAYASCLASFTGTMLFNSKTTWSFTPTSATAGTIDVFEETNSGTATITFQQTCGRVSFFPAPLPYTATSSEIDLFHMNIMLPGTSGAQCASTLVEVHKKQ
jgi:hypothetical protein